MKSLAFLISFFLASSAFAGEDRLMPSDEQSRIIAKVKYDNGAYYFTIQNNSSYVLTEGRVVCPIIFHDAVSRHEYWGSEDFQKHDKSGKFLNAYATQFEKRIIPGGKLELYVEFRYVTLRNEDCHIIDARGRKPRFFEVF